MKTVDANTKLSDLDELSFQNLMTELKLLRALAELSPEVVSRLKREKAELERELVTAKQILLTTTAERDNARIRIEELARDIQRRFGGAMAG